MLKGPFNNDRDIQTPPPPTFPFVMSLSGLVVSYLSIRKDSKTIVYITYKVTLFHSNLHYIHHLQKIGIGDWLEVQNIVEAHGSCA